MRAMLAFGIMLATGGWLLEFRVIAAEAPGPSARSPNHSLNLLDLPYLRKELALTPVQIEELILIEIDRQELFRGPLGDPMQPTVKERQAAYAEYERLVGELEKRALNVLQPQQRKRLDQILLQETVRPFEPKGGVTHPEMAPRLGLVEPQLEKVRQAAIAAEKEFKLRSEEVAAEITKARDAAHRKVLAELTPEQRATYEKLIGKPFDFTRRE